MAMLRRKPRPSKIAAVHDVFAVLNSLRNPRLAAIYLSLVTSAGTAEEIERARQLIASADTRKD